VLYRNGIGTRGDLNEAAKWFKKSADMSHDEELHSYGLALLHGRGIEKDVNEAMKYFRLAADKENAGISFRADCIEMTGDFPSIWLKLSSCIAKLLNWQAFRLPRPRKDVKN
jgi:hypothetical protein